MVIRPALSQYLLVIFYIPGSDDKNTCLLRYLASVSIVEYASVTCSAFQLRTKSCATLRAQQKNLLSLPGCSIATWWGMLYTCLEHIPESKAPLEFSGRDNTYVFRLSCQHGTISLLRFLRFSHSEIKFCRILFLCVCT